MAKRLFFSFFVTVFFLLLAVIFTPSTSAVTSCFYTKLGNPAGEVPNDPRCQGGGNQAVIELARKQLGKPYVFGGPSPRSWTAWDPAVKSPPNFDCSSLVGWAWYWGTNGKVNFPLNTKTTWGKVPPEKFKTFSSDQKGEIQPGDAIYWSTESNIHHTALFSGPCQDPKNGPGDCIIEAQQTGVPVKESNFQQRTSKAWVGFIRPIY